MSHNAGKSIWIAVYVILLLGCGKAAQAQTEEGGEHAPQFLYRDGENLILVNALTGETETLPGIVAGERDQFEWSPDGQFLAIKTETHSDGYPYSPYCLNIYSMTEHTTLYDQYIACQIEDVEISHDSEFIAYSTRGDDGRHGILWLYNRNDGTTRQVFATSPDWGLYGSGIDKIQWSPHDRYMTFESYAEIAGGNTVGLNVLNLNTLEIHGLSGGSGGYYATYAPIWSPDDNWFLLDLKEEYVAGGARPFTNQKGDLYLIHSETGEKHRITFTPAEAETSPMWTADGRIRYTIPQTVTLTLDEALDLQTPETIIEPEDVDFSMQPGCINELESPDSTYTAAICPTLKGNDRDAKQVVVHREGGDTYRVTLPKAEFYLNVLIGWRPQ